MDRTNLTMVSWLESTLPPLARVDFVRTQSLGCPMSRFFCETWELCAGVFRNESTSDAQSLFQTRRAIALAAGPWLRAILVKAFAPVMRVLHAGQVEVVLLVDLQTLK